MAPDASSRVSDEACDCLRDSVQLRISDLEGRYGLYQIAFWRMTAFSAITTILSLCREVFNFAVSEADFFVVRLLHRRKGGVLFRIKSLAFKRMILSSRAVLRTRGFHVDLA